MHVCKPKVEALFACKCGALIADDTPNDKLMTLNHYPIVMEWIKQEYTEY